MAALNERNYYQYQTTETVKAFVETLFKKKYKLKTVFKSARLEARWDAIGTFPLLYEIVRATNQLGFTVTKEQITKILSQDPEFKKIHIRHVLVAAIFAANINSVIQARENRKKRSRTHHFLVSDTQPVPGIEGATL